MTQVKSLMLTHSEVERLTGLSREVIRKWELRYGFPQPTRGERGQRRYSVQDVEKLSLLRRLVDSGMRAGAIVPLALGEVQALVEARRTPHATPTTPDSEVMAQEVQGLMTSLLNGTDAQAVTLFLQTCLLRHGLNVFAAHLMPAFNFQVGQAWAFGHMSMATEHRYTSSLRQTVLRALPDPNKGDAPPRVLLTTPPGELHSLGLLALHAQLRLQGAGVIDLDCQTPLPEVLQAARDFKVGVVAISASVCIPTKSLRRYVKGLLGELPNACQLWLGGDGCHALKLRSHPNCTLFEDTQSAMTHWKILALTHQKSSC
jgi:DNA-binding transcriptional MerR regulator